jgi:FAD:protein FMN transferase
MSATAAQTETVIHRSRAADTSREWSTRSDHLYHGIPVTVRFTPADGDSLRRAWSTLVDADAIFNIFRSDSELSAINRAKLPVDRLISPELEHGFRAAFSAHRLSHGLCDVSCGPLLELWRRAGRAGTFPDSATVDTVRARCGLDKVLLAPGRLRTDRARMSFDFGGLIKGVLVDRVLAGLRARGARSSLVQVGGETACFGISPRGGSQVLGIQHPFAEQELWAAVRDPGAGLSLSTSGNYRQPLRIGDSTCYHIIDPRSGYPCDTRIVSATVAFPGTGRNGDAEALTTAAVAMAPHDSIPLVTAAGGEALILMLEGSELTEITSPGWRRLDTRAA